MKNLINHFYHIYPDKIYKKHDIYYFYINDSKFYFLEFNRDLTDLPVLVELTNVLYEKGIKVHTFIKNIKEEFYASFDRKNYILLRTNIEENIEVDLIDIVKFNNLLASDSNLLYKNEWKTRWMNQVDKFEAQVMEYNDEYPIMRSCFDYYIGLAENAISYLKNIELETEEDKKLYLCHKRISSPITYGTLYNPLNFMFDNKTRDLAEYVKTKFFNGIFNEEEIEKILIRNNYAFSVNDASLFYARLLYPTYYFDFFEKVINGEILEEKFEKFINLSQNFESLLLELYVFLKSRYNIEPIDWLVNK